MKKSDYDKFYQKGGSYIIPVEIFNELFDELETWKEDARIYKEIINEITKFMSSEKINELEKNMFDKNE